MPKQKEKKLDRRMKYSMFLHFLNQLRKEDLINDDEYQRILVKIRKDFGVLSELTY